MAKLVIFDSGLGGLSIFSEIQKSLPEHLELPCIYVMDNDIFPYGIRSTEELLPRILTICTALVSEHQPDLLVIACNTASTFALPALRQALDIPVVGVVPAIKTAAEKSQSLHIGLIATPATVNRNYTDQLISDHAKHCQIHRLGTSELVTLAEDYLLQRKSTAQVELELKALLDDFFRQNEEIDYAVLGCTHFPLLAKPLSQLYPTIHWVDSGQAIARRVLHLLAENKLEIEASSSSTHQLIMTAALDNMPKLNQQLAAIGQFSAAQRIRLA